jgi:hypothetical protein
VSLYRCYFMGSMSHISDVQDVEAGDDDEAIRLARHLVAGRPLCTAEIWQHSRLVRRNIWPSPPRPAAAIYAAE